MDADLSSTTADAKQMDVDELPEPEVDSGESDSESSSDDEANEAKLLEEAQTLEKEVQKASVLKLNCQSAAM